MQVCKPAYPQAGKHVCQQARKSIDSNLTAVLLIEELRREKHNKRPTNDRNMYADTVRTHVSRFQ